MISCYSVFVRTNASATSGFQHEALQATSHFGQVVAGLVEDVLITESWHLLHGFLYGETNGVTSCRCFMNALAMGGCLPVLYEISSFLIEKPEALSSVIPHMKWFLTSLR